MGYPKGSDHPRTKLKELDVLQIRKMVGTKTYQQIANRFGVNKQAIYQIAKGKTWKHI